MATGTEGPDVLGNNPSLSSDTIHALGGDDIIKITNPTQPYGSTGFSRVTVNGGDGFDTLTLSSFMHLGPNGASIFTGYTGIFIFHNQAVVTWSEVERLVISGTSYSGRAQDGSYLGTHWSTGDTIDEISVRTVGGAWITLSTGGGNDKVTIERNVGGRSGVDAGPGDDVVDLRGTSVTTRWIFYPPDYGPISYLFANGEDGNDILLGSAYEDRLNGGAGDDELRSGLGKDTLTGGAGNDLLYFGAGLDGTDVADGGDGRDSVVLQGNYSLRLGAAQMIGVESISLRSGADTRFGDSAGNLYGYALTTADGNVAAGQQMIVNGQSLRAGEDFTLDGSAETDSRFLAFAGHGVDTLTGGSGNDLFVFEGDRWGAGDRVDGRGGSDSVVIAADTGLAHIEFAADSLAGIESISVNNHYASDRSQRPSYEFVLHNGNVAPGGTLIVNGGSLEAGQVIKVDGRGVHDGRLMLFGGGDHDTLSGGGGPDTILGGAGADDIDGGGGHDTLTGGDGADSILGGAGADGLTGGGGADTFRYDSVSDSTARTPDTIGDFQTGLDQIDLSRIDANTHAAGDQAFTWIGSNAFDGTGAASAGQLRIIGAVYRRIEGDTDGDGLADLFIILQIGTAPLAQGDFVL